MKRTQTWQEALLTMDDATQPLLQIKYTGDTQDGGTGTTAVTPSFTIDNDGATSTLDIVLTDYNGTLNLSGTATASHTTVATLDALVDAINAREGWSVVRYNGAGDYPLNTDDFIDATIEVGRSWTNALYRDADQVLVSALRLSNAQTGDRGKIQIGMIQGVATYGSGAVTVAVTGDPDIAANETPAIDIAAGATTVPKNIGADLFDLDAPLMLDGPVLIEVTGSAALSACTYRVLWRPYFG